MMLSTALEGLHFAQFVEDVFVNPNTLEMVIECSNKKTDTDPPVYTGYTVRRERENCTILVDVFKIRRYVFDHPLVKTNDVELFGF